MKNVLAGSIVAISLALAPVPVRGAEVPVDSGTLFQLLEQLIIAKSVDIMAQNIRASERETGDINKAVRATLGISIKDIESYGLLGGPNSEMRKLFKALGLPS